MVVVLNQVDRLTPAERERCLRDLRRLLASEGLPGSPGAGRVGRDRRGVAGAAGELARQVADKQAAARRLAADVARAADALAAASGHGELGRSWRGPASSG